MKNKDKVKATSQFLNINFISQLEVIKENLGHKLKHFYQVYYVANKPKKAKKNLHPERILKKFFY